MAQRRLILAAVLTVAIGGPLSVHAWGPRPTRNTSHIEPPPPRVDLLSVLSYGPPEIPEAFWSPQTRNVLCLGDSIMSNGSSIRLYDAILRAWNLPAGWRGFHASTSGAAGVRRWRGFTEAYDGEDAGRAVLAVTDACLGGGHYYGLPHQHLDHDVGVGFLNLEPGRRIERVQVRPGPFDIGVVGEWFTGHPITMQLMYLYHGAPGPGPRYVADIDVGVGVGQGDLDGGPWSYPQDFAPQHGLSDIATGGSGLNLLSRKHPIPTDQGPGAMQLTLRSTDDWEAPEDLRCVHVGVKVAGGPGGVMAGVLGENTWDSGFWGIDAPAAAGLKQLTNQELDRYLDLMFDDKASPLYVIVAEGHEPTSVADYVAHNHARNDRLVAAWQRVGGDAVRFIYLGTYRTYLDDLARFQNYAFYATADQRDDTYYVNVYGLLGGIHWNSYDIGGDQSAFAEARGWDAITINGGTLDMSARNALDLRGVHPRDAEAAFFFAWVAGEQIRQVAGR